jgi:SAM-dependent methyltransferase
MEQIRSREFRQNYSRPEIYDIAFDFRDVPSEADFLLSVGSEHFGREIVSSLELCCGPGYHTREMSRRGLESHGLDLSREMVAYTNRLIASEKLACRIYEGDMRSFQAPQKYDLVYCLMASFAQLLTNEDILRHFDCVADLLADGGIYIISTAHPRDFYGDGEASTENSWTMTRGDIAVETSWGGSNQQFDPLTEVDDIIVSYEVTDTHGTVRYEFPDKYRRCSMMTFLALLELSGRFSLVDTYGAFDRSLKLSNDRKCWRFIPVLKKIK